MPLDPVAGVPLSTPVDPLNETPVGSAPLPPRVGVGKPVAVTVKVPAFPTANVVLLALVIVGAWKTVSAKPCVPFGATPLLAVMVMLYVPPVPAAGVPLSTPAALRLTPLGSVPASVKVIAVGKPEAVTVNDPADPTANVVLFALVIAGAWFTVRVKFCVPFGNTPLLAVMVIG